MIDPNAGSTANIASLSAAIQRDPQNPANYNVRGSAYGQAGQFQAALADFTAWSRQALAPHAVWLAMKGRHPSDEIAALPATVQVFHVEPLTVPGLDAERCIVWMRPAATEAVA